MAINSSYNFGLLIDDGTTTSAPTSLQNLKSFTVTYNNGTFTVNNTLSDYEVLYYNTTQTDNANRLTYSGLVVLNKKGNNFVILCDNTFQQFITSAQFLLFSSSGNGPTTGIPSMNILFGYEPVTYPELPTFINGYNGYNVPNTVFTTNPTTYTFYIMD